MASVDSKHPDYAKLADDWQIMRDCEQGERAVKQGGERHLMMPSGFKEQDDGGALFYTAYQQRAQFPDILQPTLAGMVGVIHRVEIQVTGLEEGKPLAKLWEKCTPDGLPLEAFARLVTTELLQMGRYGILVDVPTETRPNGDLPFFAGYTTERIINWTDASEKNLFVLDESGLVQGKEDEFSWTDEKKHRVLRFNEKDGYSAQIYDNDGVAGEQMTAVGRANKKLEEIPFFIVNPRGVSMMLDPPPLLGVAKAALAIYRLDADYRHQLFHTGQDTLFLLGVTQDVPKLVGAGVIIGLPKDTDAKYVGPGGTGIAAHRLAIQDERQNAVAAGVRLFDTQKQAESGEALRLRAAAQTATLTTIAQASAAALERALRMAAIFVGQNPDEIVVKPNLTFVDTKMTSKEAVDLVSVWQSGGISKLTLYENLQKGEIASAERTFEEEQELITQEALDNPQATGEGQPIVNPDGEQPTNGTMPLMNGGAAGGDMSRFVETGEGLVVEKV
jgi:hypothetical protein